MERNCNFGSDRARDVILVSNPMVSMGMGQQLRQFSGTPDSGGQEQGGGAVGGQG